MMAWSLTASISVSALLPVGGGVSGSSGIWFFGADTAELGAFGRRLNHIIGLVLAWVLNG